MIRFIRSHAKAVVAGGVSAAVITSGAVAYAAVGSGSQASPASFTSAASTSSGSSTSSTSPGSGSKSAGSKSAGSKSSKAARRARGIAQLRGLVIGEITAISTTGGAAGDGTITVTPHDGTAVTASLAPKTRVLIYEGPKVKATSGSVTDLADGELVAVRVVARRAAGSGTDTTTTTAANTATTAANTATTAATAATAGTPYAALVIDLGYSAS